MNDCIEFEGLRTRTGYGFIWDKKRQRMNVAHRIAWEEKNGAIPQGLGIHHKCENKACVNVEHMELITQADHNRLHKCRPLIIQVGNGETICL